MTSALTPAGSTRRWRRLRVLVLMRDGERCQLPVDAGDSLDPRPCLAPATLGGPTAGHVDHVVERRHADQHGLVTLPDGRRVHVDAPSNLRASCASCNLRRRRGADQPTRAGPKVPPAVARESARRWSW